MTLLEAVVATVLLALVAVACLDGTGQAARLQHRSMQASGTVAHAAAELERARLDLPSSPQTRVRRRPYAPLPGAGEAPLELLTVDVTDAEGRTVQLARLVPRASNGTGPYPRLPMGARP